MKKYTQEEFDDLPRPLRQHDLSGLDLSGLDLSGLDFSSANLKWANLSGANLSGANLVKTDMTRANLTGVDLSGADLAGANVFGAEGFLSVLTRRYDVYVGVTHTKIGCKWHSNAEWRNFSDEQISKKAPDALDWWKKYKRVVFGLMDILESEATNEQF